MLDLDALGIGFWRLMTIAFIGTSEVLVFAYTMDDTQREEKGGV